MDASILLGLIVVGNGAIINIDNPSNYGFTLRTAMYSYTDSSGTIWLK